MLMFAPPAEMFEHGEPSAYWHGGRGGGSEYAAGAPAIATAAAPANNTGVNRASFANMSSVYHQNDERDSRASVTLLPRLGH
jgi:hypothetical protein